MSSPVAMMIIIIITEMTEVACALVCLCACVRLLVCIITVVACAEFACVLAFICAPQGVHHSPICIHLQRVYTNTLTTRTQIHLQHVYKYTYNTYANTTLIQIQHYIQMHTHTHKMQTNTSSYVLKYNKLASSKLR